MGPYGLRSWHRAEISDCRSCNGRLGLLLRSYWHEGIVGGILQSPFCRLHPIYGSERAVDRVHLLSWLHHRFLDDGLTMLPEPIHGVLIECGFRGEEFA